MGCCFSSDEDGAHGNTSHASSDGPASDPPPKPTSASKPAVAWDPDHAPPPVAVAPPPRAAAAKGGGDDAAVAAAKALAVAEMSRLSGMSSLLSMSSDGEEKAGSPVVSAAEALSNLDAHESREKSSEKAVELEAQYAARLPLVSEDSPAIMADIDESEYVNPEGHVSPVQMDVIRVGSRRSVVSSHNIDHVIRVSSGMSSTMASDDGQVPLPEPPSF